MYDWTNPDTGKVEKIPMGIDPGWAYNPGEALWGRNWALSEMEKFDSGKWTDVDPRGSSAYDRPEVVPVDAPEAALGKIAKTEADLRAALRNALGGDEAFFQNPAGETILANQAIVDHMLEQTKRWDGREAFFPFIPELIKDPYEIWINFAKDELTGIYGLRQKYVKVIQLDKQRSLAFVAEASEGKWIGFTFFRGRPETINDVRSGRLLWGR